MMTLDDVIEAMDRCSIPHYFDCKGCPYEDDDAEVGCRSDDRDADALHYLKTYRENQQTYIENSRKAEEARERYLEVLTDYVALKQYWAEQQENEPLTWEEFCKMGDKPVWIKVHGAKALHTSGWALVGNTSFTTWAGVPSCSLVKVGVTYALPIDEYGKTWQAYRKEVDVSLES